MTSAGKTFVSILLAASAFAGGRSLVQRAPDKAAQQTNPLAGSERDRLAGAKLYARECASCHGASRQGDGKVPPLVQPEVLSTSPGVLFWVMTNGSLRRGMPTFAHLPEPERWQIITFLQASTAQ